MSYNSIMRMPPEKWTVFFERDLLEIISDPSQEFLVLKEAEGHGDIHYTKNEGRMLRRILKEGKPAASYFYSPEIARATVANMLLLHSKEISDWLYSEKSEFRDKNDYFNFAITANTDDKSAIGQGINNKFRRQKTTAITIVLGRDFSDTTLNGFRIVTAYPELVKRPDVVETIGEPIPLKEMVRYKGLFRDNIEKLTTHCTEKWPNAKFLYVDGKDRQRTSAMGYQHKYKDGKIRIFVEKNRYRIGQILPNDTRPLSFSEYLLNCPEGAKVLNEILNDKDRIVDGRLDSLRLREDKRDTPGDQAR